MRKQSLVWSFTNKNSATCPNCGKQCIFSGRARNYTMTWRFKSIKILDNTSDSLSSPNACGDDTVLLIQSFHIMGDLDGQFAARATQWMAEGNGTAIYINDGRIQFQ